MLSQAFMARKRTSAESVTYPFLLSGEGKGVRIQLRPSLMANIVAIAEARKSAIILATDGYENSAELDSVRGSLEADGWSVNVRLASAAEVRGRYGLSADAAITAQKSTNPASTNTTTFDLLLTAAINARADELHYHVRGKICEITHLIDGRIVQAESLTARDAIEVLSSAFTNLAEQNSYEPNKSSFAHASVDQSCMIKRTINGSHYKLRYSTVPEADGGFDVTMRILPQAEKGQVPTLEKLGFVPSFIRLLRAATERRRGAIYVCGPVGGGKTTTLYSLLYRQRDQRDRYIVTVEDPPEYEQEGITQIPVEKLGHDKLEKKLLRMGVHWCLVGEVRDHLMGRLVKVLSETGQKVFTTCHVLNANQIIDRLTSDEIGISRQTLCDTDMVAALTYTCLVPKLCAHCSISATEEGAVDDRIRQQMQRLEIPLESVRVAKTAGCPHCSGGRRGRQPVVEIIIPDATYLRCMREGRDGDAKEYWLNSCRSHVTHEDVTGKPMMATALYWVSKGKLDPLDLEREIDALESFTPRVSRKNALELRAA